MTTKRPKRALSAYMFFTDKEQNAIRDRNPDMGFRELGRELGRVWSTMSDADKAPYVAMEERDKQRAQDGLAQDAVVFGCPICTRPCRVISPTQHTCDRCGIAWHAAGCGVETAAPPPLVLLPSDWGPRGWHYDGGRDWTPDTINVGLEMEWHRAPRCPLCKDKLVEQQLPWANRWIYNDLEYEHPWCKRCDINWFRYNAEEFARMQARVL